MKNFQLLVITVISASAFWAGCQPKSKPASEPAVQANPAQQDLYRTIAEGKDNFRHYNSQIVGVLMGASELEDQTSEKTVTAETRTKLAIALRNSEKEIEKISPELEGKALGVIQEIYREMDKLSNRLEAEGNTRDIRHMPRSDGYGS